MLLAVTKRKLTFQYLFTYEKDIIEPIPSQSHRVSEEDTQDPLISWQLETEVYILLVILVIGIIAVVGLINRQVENALLFALFVSGIIIALVLSLFS